MAALRSAAALAALALLQHVQAWNIDLPVCTEPFQPFVYSGCYQDLHSPAALTFRSTLSSYNMTMELCVAECKGNGFRYAGLEYHGECFCGETVNGPQVDDAQCTFPCSGNKSETCGGNSLLSVWQDTTFLPLDNQTVSDYVPLGCYTDDSSIGRALGWPMDIPAANMTTEACLSACFAAGYPFAGTEYGGECYCGAVVGNFSTQADASGCSMACKGDSSETCGGRSRLSLYVAKDLESLQPCGYVPSPSSSSVPPGSSTTTSSSSATTTCNSTLSTSSWGSSTSPSHTAPPSNSSTWSWSWSSTPSSSASHTVWPSNTSTSAWSSTSSSSSSYTSTPCNTSTSTSTWSWYSTSSVSASSTAPPSNTSTRSWPWPPTSTSSGSSKWASSTVSPSSTSTWIWSSTSTSSWTPSSNSSWSGESCSSTSTSTSSAKTSSSTSTSSANSWTSSWAVVSSTTSTVSNSTTTGPTHSTTSAYTSTTKPSTTKGATSTATSSLCTATSTAPSKCEYGCGSWCSSELPDFDDVEGCKDSYSSCHVQIAACFKNAGWPGSMGCFDFAGWCDDISSYCSSGGSKGGRFSKADCLSTWKPKGGQPATTATSVYPCAPATTAKATSNTARTTSATSKTTSTTSRTTSTTAKTTTTTTAPTKCPIPTPTGICKQPSNRAWGYGEGSPVGGIELPVLTCNDLRDDFNRGNQFKLYTDSDSAKCGSYPRRSVPSACADACKAQHDACVATYAEGCKSNGGSGKRASSSPRARGTPGNYFDWARTPGKRTAWTDSYATAIRKCDAQYSDCLAQNEDVTGAGRCGSWGSGW